MRRSTAADRRNIVLMATLALPVLAVLLCAPPATAGAQRHRIDPDPAFALPGPETKAGEAVNSASLVENARAWDGRTVTFTGEAVGERMVRGKHAWIHLNDDAYMWKNIEEGAALGGYNSGHAVWVAADDARRIAFFGDYKHEGDIVRVVGTFHAACREHGGDMDIHADSLVLLRPGHPVEHVINGGRLLIAVALLLLAGILWELQRRAARRRI